MLGVLRGGVEPGCSVAIIGAGPVGLAALLTAQLYSPGTIMMIDKDEGRLKVAMRMGATRTYIIQLFISISPSPEFLAHKTSFLTKLPRSCRALLISREQC